MRPGRSLNLIATIKDRLFGVPAIPAAIALAVIVALGFVAEYQNRTIYRQDVRGAVAEKLSFVRTQIEGRLAGDIQLIVGFVALLGERPWLSQPEFSRLMARMLEHGANIRNVGVAPDLVISMVYPLKGNEKALGLDYRSQPVQLPSVLRARDSGHLVLSGPVALVQGGTGLIGRFPVFTGDARGRSNFWGVVSVVFDVDRLYASAGITDNRLGLRFALVGRDGTGAKGDLFYGDREILRSDPVTTEISIPGGKWLIAAVPTGGWDTTPPNSGELLLMIFGAGLLVAVPLLVTGHLYVERRRHMDELARRGDALERLSNRLGLALDASRVGVWEMDIATRILVWDDRMHALYDLPRRALPISDQAWIGKLHPDDRERAVGEFEQAIASGKRYRSEFRIVRSGGEVRTLRAVGTVHETTSGLRTILGLNWDVTRDIALQEELTKARDLAEARTAQLEVANSRIAHTSLHDALTGLPNRRYLTNFLEALEGAETGHGRQIAVLHLDLDRFKQINDTFGHATGDAMLVHATTIMRTVFGPDDFVARFGGDEFIAVCQGDDVVPTASDIACRLIEAMSKPVVHDGHPCRFSVSIGIASADRGHVQPSKLLINADIALYRAKKHGRGRYEFFTDAIEAEVMDSKRIADEVVAALDAGQFIPHYQPQFDTVTNCVVGAEALARWRHPERGILPPAAFLRIAEDMGVLADIDRSILVQAVADRKRWRAMGVEIPRISVNVSLKRLQNALLADEVRALAVDPGSITFEVVETSYLDEDETVVRNVETLKALGIEIDLDDFGTGHASIVSLTRLRPSRLKIARELTVDVVTSLPQRRLVRSIVEIGAGLAVGIVAEGVETMEQAEVLRDLGCDVLQGFALSPPLDGAAFFSLMARKPSALAVPARRI